MRAGVKNGVYIRIAAVVAGMLVSGIGGCASEPPKSSAQPMTPEHVRGHADKAFGDLKQEERQRGSAPGGTTY